MATSDGSEGRKPNKLDQPVDQAKIDTKADSSPQTTVPDLQAAGFVLPTTDYVPGTDSEPADVDSKGVPSEGAVSHGSFSGLLGRYQYVGTLGEGSFGLVVRAWDPELEAYRAIKVPHRELVDSGRVNPESYVKEARKVAQLGKHEGIVSVLDVQRMDDGLPFVVSEYISGGDLANWLKSRQVSWRDAVRIVADIADAVAFAHRKGVVHRDLKPANILMTAEGKPVVGDFGLALGDDDFSYRKAVCGTYQYMSPEQLQGKADRVDGRADIYSLGVILYELLAGRSPYKSKKASSLKREVIEGALAPVRQYAPDIPDELEAICRKALANDPKQRFSTATDMSDELRATLSSESAVAVAPSSSSGGPIWVGVFAGAALVVAVAAFLLPSREPSTPPPTAAPTITDPDLEIHLQKAGEKGTFRGIMARGDLPLEVGDKLQFHVSLAEPMYAYVYWIDFRGKATRQWPDPALPLSDQRPVKELHSPAEVDGENAQWWEVAETGGPEVILLGVSKRALNDEQLERLEASGTSLANMLGQERLLCEFEFPEQQQKYVKIDGGLYVTRGAGQNPIVSPKTIPDHHSQLSKLFSAYHGWVFATE